MNPYSKTYYDQSRSRYTLKSWLRETLQTWRQPSALYAALLNLPEGATVVDIGCGEGEILERIATLRTDLYLIGVDIIDLPSPSGSLRIRGSATALPVRDSSLDFVICRHVIEHLTNGPALVAEIARTLKLGAICYLECPDVRSVTWCFGDNFYDDPTHVRPYTRAALRRLLEIHDIETTAVARIRDWRVVAGGPLYWPIATLAGDRHFLWGWCRHLVGAYIYALGRRKH